MSLISNATRAAVEGFTGNNQDPSRSRAIYTDMLAALLAFFLSIVILGFVGKLLWNNIVVELISVAKPAKSFWQILGLMIFLSLVRA